MLKHRNKTVLPDYFVIDSPLTEQKIFLTVATKYSVQFPVVAKGILS